MKLYLILAFLWTPLAPPSLQHIDPQVSLWGRDVLSLFSDGELSEKQIKGMDKHVFYLL